MAKSTHITTGQIGELLRLDKIGRVNRVNLERYLSNPNVLDPDWDTVTVEDQLKAIEHREGGEKNLADRLRQLYEYFEVAREPGLSCYVGFLLLELFRGTAEYGVPLHHAQLQLDRREPVRFNPAEASSADRRTGMHECDKAVRRLMHGERILPYELLVLATGWAAPIWLMIEIKLDWVRGHARRNCDFDPAKMTRPWLLQRATIFWNEPLTRCLDFLSKMQLGTEAGYEPRPCVECNSFALVRTGTTFTCITCGTPEEVGLG